MPSIKITCSVRRRRHHHWSKRVVVAVIVPWAAIVTVLVQADVKGAISSRQFTVVVKTVMSDLRLQKYMK